MSDNLPESWRVSSWRREVPEGLDVCVRDMGDPPPFCTGAFLDGWDAGRFYWSVHTSGGSVEGRAGSLSAAIAAAEEALADIAPSPKSGGT